MFAFFPAGGLPFFCPSLILRSLSIPPLSFALLGDLLSLIFLLVGHFCSQELCRRINQVDFSIATLSKPRHPFVTRKMYGNKDKLWAFRLES